MNLELMKKIVDDAPRWAVTMSIATGIYYDESEVSKGDIWLIDLRLKLAKHEPMDLRAVDIPRGTIVLEK